MWPVCTPFILSREATSGAFGMRQRCRPPTQRRPATRENLIKRHLIAQEAQFSLE